ncbi:hypothetical protein N9W89_00625 [Hellea sp.]|nr:hypothetical protein [Hellea sp.]
MRFKYFKPLLLIPVLIAVGCSQQVEAPPGPKPYVTNAAYVLDAMKNNKTSAVAFQVKPIRTTACESMYIEFGQQNSEGQWDVTNAVFPGKNSLDNFGQDKLMDQIHFVEVDGQGEFGVLAFGCKPYGQELKTYRGLQATFTVDYGRLNYIGELALIPEGREFSTVEVANRTEFAKKQIQAQLPDLEPFFQENIMEKYVPKLSKELQAALDAMDAQTKALQPLLNLRNAVARDLNSVNTELHNWKVTYGYVDANTPRDVEKKFKLIIRKKGALKAKLALHDTFIDEGRNLRYVKRYMFLLDDYEKKQEKYRAELGDKFPSFKDKPSAKAIELMWDMTEAQDALRTFKENNP